VGKTTMVGRWKQAANEIFPTGTEFAFKVIPLEDRKIRLQLVRISIINSDEFQWDLSWAIIQMMYYRNSNICFGKI
jgi:hypothetical protein